MPAALSARRTTNRRLNDVAAALQAAPGSQGLAAPLADVDALGATTMVHPPRDHFKYLLVAPDVTLRVVVEGAGPLVVLLHGFPQGWYLWRHTIKPLVDAGFRVAAPDQRGYGMSSAPEAPEAYGLRSLTSDVVQLAKGLGHEQFYLVGHDWGCQVAWHVAALYPDSVLAVLGLDVPYTRDPSRGGVSKQLQDDPSRFWYIKEFMENADKLEVRAVEQQHQRALPLSRSALLVACRWHGSRFFVLRVISDQNGTPSRRRRRRVTCARGSIASSGHSPGTPPMARGWTSSRPPPAQIYSRPCRAHLTLSRSG